ncbi:MAG: hypothetical protein ABI666_06290 [Ferruginibacter sp.]
MTISSKIISTMLGIFISTVSFVQPNNTVVEYLSVPGPITINNYTYNLSWSSHPSADYYKQEYIGAKDNAEKYNKMVSVEVLLGDAKPADLAKTKINELNQLKQTNPIVNYETFQKNGEVILDFLLSQNSPDGKKIIILERNVYRYKAVTDKNGKKGVMLFGISERSYGNDADTFLSALKKNKSVLINAVAAFNIPEISIKK